MRSRTWKLARLVAPIGLIPLFACLAPPVESPKTTVTQETSVRVEQSVKNKVDLLFMIDNSPSMAPKQNELRNRFPQLIKALQTLRDGGQPGVVSHRRRHVGPRRRPVHAQPGPVPSGRRRRQAPGHAGRWRRRPANCASFSLRAACASSTTTSSPAPTTSSASADLGRRVHLHGVRRRVGLRLRAPARVGLPRAPRSDIPENDGFLRDDALLVVVFVTDEDDCSAPPTAISSTRAPDGISMYGTLHSFRCTQFGMQCGGMPVPPTVDVGA